MIPHRFQFLVGIDLGRWLHQACVLDANGELVAERGFAHSREGLSETVSWLSSLAAKDKRDHIAVAIEKPHGAVVDSLLARGLAVFAVNPKQVDRFRDRHSLSGAKDDRRDAFVLADSLRTDGHRFQRLQLPSPEIIALRQLLSARIQLIKLHVALSSQMQDLLLQCRPHLLSLAPRNRPLDSFFCELLEMCFHPHPRSPAADNIRALIRKHHIRRVKLDDVLRIVQQPSLQLASGTLEALSAHLALLLPQLQLVRCQRRDVDRYLERWFQQIQRDSIPGQLSDAAVLASLPGVGALVLATLLGHAHDALRLRNLHALRSLGGIAPVTKQSGQRRQVLMRRARSQPLNYALHHWAAIAVLRDPHFKHHYQRLRRKGHHHARALRGVMDRLLSVAVAMLRDRSFYDPSRFKKRAGGKT